MIRGWSGPRFPSGRLTSARRAGLALLSLAWMAYSFVGQQSDLARMRAAIDERGNIAQVFVSHREIPDVAGELATADEFRFVGTGIELPSYQVSPVLPASIAQQRFDRRGLVNFVRRDCTLERRRGTFESDQLIYCKSNTPIEIAYLSPLTKDDFYLPDFRPRFYYREITNWILYPSFTVAICLAFAFLLVALPWVLFSAFLGLDPQEALDEIS